jgi:cytochrome P450
MRIRADSTQAEPGNRSHLAWGTGPHACPAHLPARIIARAAVETALNQLPGLCLDIPGTQISLIPSPWSRRPASLPVRFTVAPAPRSPARDHAASAAVVS